MYSVKNMAILASNTMERLMKHLGADRVSEKAKEEMVECLEKTAKQITEKSVTLSKHAKRKTVMKEDVKLAYEELFEKR